MDSPLHEQGRVLGVESEGVQVRDKVVALAPRPTFSTGMEGAELGAYRVESEIGSGGMGTVYLAEVVGEAPGLDAGARVAVKVVHPHLLETPGVFKRFLREAEIGKSVEHENVVRCFDFDALLVDGRQQNFLVMEYVEGQTLQDLLHEIDRLPEELCRHVGREVAKGLAAIHAAGAVHRDLKPANVLITPEQIVKVMDLGVARVKDEAMHLSETGAFVGSLLYAAPEQLQAGGSGVDARSDLHGLGVMLYELSTGRHPFRDADLAVVIRKILQDAPRPAGAVNPQLSAFFEEVLGCLLAKEKDDRFPSAADVHDVLASGEASAWWTDRASTLRRRTDRPLRRVRIPRETALYGREEDLDGLHALYERAKTGAGQVVLIRGEAGIGKTRLVDELVARLERDGEDVNFLFGSHPPGGVATAAGALATAYREHLGAERLDEAIASHLDSMPLLVPAFAALLGGGPPPPDVAALTPESLATAFVQLTRSLATQRPTIVLIDDLHFASAEGRALFETLALAVPAHRILLVGTTRPGIPQGWVTNLARQVSVSQTTLARLGAKDLVRLLQDAFRSEHLAQELAGKIALKSDGNPYFVFEIIQGLREGQFITKKPDGTWVTTQIIEDIQVPASVVDLVSARIADLREEERDVLDVASCCGYEFDPLLLAAVLERGEIEVLKRLGHLEKKASLVRASGRSFVFDHHQVQEAIYQGISELLRERYHARIAEAMEARGRAAAEDPEAWSGKLLVTLCDHFLEGGQGRRVAPYLDRALAHLWRAFLHERGVELARRGLAVPGLLEGPHRAAVLLDQAEHLDFLGRRDAEHAALEEALSLAETLGDTRLRAKAHRAFGGYFLTIGHFDESRDALGRALELARETGDTETEFRANANLGQTHLHQGHHAEARPYFERQLEIAQATGHAEGESGAYVNLGHVLYRRGDYESASASYERSQVVANAAGDRLGVARSYAGLGGALFRLGRVEEAQEVLARSLELTREMGERRGEALVTGNLGHVLLSLGRLDEARSCFARDLALAEEMGDREGVARATANLGIILSRLGRQKEAREHYERQLALSHELNDCRGVSAASNSLGYLLLHMGRHEEARRYLEESLAVSREIGHRQGEGRALGNLAHLLWHLGLVAEAREHFEAWRTLGHDMANPRTESMANERLGLVALSLGLLEDAQEHYDLSLELARSIEDPVLEREALLGHGALVGARGDAAGARRLRGEALAVREEPGEDGSALDALVALGFFEDPALPRAQIPESVAATAVRGPQEAKVSAATTISDERGARSEQATRLHALFTRWLDTGDAAHLREAKRSLDHLVAHAPEACRVSLVENVPLHRNVAAAWKEHGA